METSNTVFWQLRMSGWTSFGFQSSSVELSLLPVMFSISEPRKLMFARSIRRLVQDIAGVKTLY